MPEQVKDALAGKRPEDAGPAPLISSGREVLPALGLAWANCVTMRIFLSRHAVHAAPQPGPGGDQQWDTGATAVQRAMQVIQNTWSLLSGDVLACTTYSP